VPLAVLAQAEPVATLPQGVKVANLANLANLAKNSETYVIAIFAIHHSVRGGAKNLGLGETARHTAEILRSRAQI